MSVDRATRDALAVMAAQLRGDEQGVAALIGDCDLPAVAVVLADYAAEAVRLAGGREVGDGDLAELLGVHLRRLAGGSTRGGGSC
ncbi:hypothetical protein [Streptacidiphilus carbonis]|uniref:hypothetical protein n=1 Tax=Streptacidiphilus carbonis TaxID=105422 RepID=UPI0005A67868|nr:hypothetical protein [Streptacidiphilus carbonis]